MNYPHSQTQLDLPAQRVRLARVLGLALLFSPLLTPAVERPLFNFNPGSDLKQIKCKNATVALVRSKGHSALRINTGHPETHAGITLPAPGGSWDLSAYARVVLQVKNAGSNSVTVVCQVDNPGAQATSNCLTRSLALSPGQTNALKVFLRREAGSNLGGKLFGMLGYPAAAGGTGTLDVKNVTQLQIFVKHPTGNHCIEVSDIRAMDDYTPPTARVTDANPFFPFIDTFGQYKHKDWPGKVHSVEELQQNREAEAKDLNANPGPRGWDEYGGWAKGPRLKATGFFRTEKVKGKWWLVDPEGHLFWSHGINCVCQPSVIAIEDRASWFADFPGDLPDFHEFLRKGYALKGYYAGRSPECFSFAEANLKRKYGNNWKQDNAETIQRRLRSWGLNTIANWSDPIVFLMRRAPYTDTFGSHHGSKMIEGSEGYWGKFPDVFDPSFTNAVRKAMQAKQNSSANDPWCIGYFSDNEMSWGNETSLSLAVLKSSSQQAAKRQFVDDLKAKYGNIARLNTAWGTHHASWDALIESRDLPDPARARDDLAAFNGRIAETYFCTVRDAIKAVAPHQLYLGCRFAWGSDGAAKAAGRYCDVVSYNLYRRSIADFKYPGEDKPLIVGEFHFGAWDRGMFNPGLVTVDNQRARAQAYRDYVLGALHHPQIVGAHWFQWQDEPNIGRVYDEENYQMGFVDVADTPYPETIAACREMGRRLYKER